MTKDAEWVVGSIAKFSEVYGRRNLPWMLTLDQLAEIAPAAAGTEVAADVGDAIAASHVRPVAGKDAAAIWNVGDDKFDLARRAALLELGASLTKDIKPAS